MNIKKIMTGFTTGTVMFALVGTVAFAAPITKSQCEAKGGVYTNDQGTKTCVTTDEWNVDANAGGGPGQTQWGGSGTTTDSESQQGAIGAPGTSDTHDESSASTVDSCQNPSGHEMKTTNPKCVR